MKSLKRLRLINWHYFYNVNVEFDRINFLTGENAAGKSTLIDAMQLLLLGDTSGRIFNKAANEKAGRTLKGYLKGEIGDDGEGAYRYLRNGRFTTYIAMEFYDDVVDKSFTLGIVFDVYEDGTEQHKFFMLEDKFPHNDFCSLNVPLSQKELALYFSQNYSPKDYNFFDTNAQYQLALKDRFGNIKDKYFSLFKKAVSFIPITNIEQFITEYVCDVTENVDVSSMRDNIQQYKRLEIEATDMERKISKLEKIHEAYLDLQNKQNDLNLAAYISKRVSYQVNLDVVKNLQHDLQSNEIRLQEIASEIENIDKEIKSLQEKKENYIATKVSSSSYQLSKDLELSKQDTIAKINRIENNITSDYQKLLSYINNFINQIARLNAGINSLDENFKKEHLTRFIELEDKSKKLYDIATSFKQKLNSKEDLSKDILLSFRDAINEFKNACSEHYGYFKTLISSELAKLHAAKQSLQDTSATGGKLYDYHLKQVHSQLMHALEDHYGKKIEVFFFADLVDIKDKKWVNAIEGFIFSQKVNMFVEEKYYETANKLLTNILRRNNYFRTGLVDTERLRSAGLISEDNSLAEEILTDHEGAALYAKFLLGKMIKCDNFQEARASGRGLTPTCEGYRNYASFVIPNANYQYKLIGRQVSESDKKERLNEIQNKIDKLNAVNEFNKALESCAHEETLSNNEAEIYSSHLEDASMLETLKNKLQEYESELLSSVSQEISILDKKIAQIDEDIESLQTKRESLIEERGDLNASNRQIQNEKIPAQIENSNKLLDEMKNEFSDEFITQVALPTFNDELEQGKSLGQIRSEYDELFAKGQYKLRNAKAILNELRKDYIVEYKLSYDITREDNNDFDNELYNLKEVKLPTYKDKITDAYNKATKEFKDDFIFKLKTAIESVRTQIDELNIALNDATFGQDSYQFTVTPAPQYKEYYDMITDELLLSYGEDENLYLEKYKDIMANLFKLIGDVSGSNDQNSLLAQNVAKFTDYRTYLLFDLMVSKDGGKPYSLGRNIKKASGGETQTPFYISILASFSQLYRVKSASNLSNTVRLVVFDEAFSKMDRNRIIESIRILKSFGLQVILSAPPEKASDISKIVDRTLLVTRGKNRSFVDSFKELVTTSNATN